MARTTPRGRVHRGGCGDPSSRRACRVVGKLPVNAQINACYSVVRPDDGPIWQIRAQVQFMFPE